MKKIGILFSLIISFQITGVTQSCLPNGIIFHTQDAIDNFQVDYPNCTEIEGDVTIWGLTGDITNLDGLNVLTAIGGSLEFRNNTRLKNIVGFENLTSIGGLYINQNDSLLNIDAFENVTHVGGSININTNYLMTTFKGLNSLNSVNENLIIQSNFALTNFTAFGSLINVDGYINISANYDLTYIIGFENLTNVGGDFFFGDGDLTDLNNFNSLGTTGGNFTISSLDCLLGLSGLENLTSIGGYLSIDGNFALTDISSLSNLNFVGQGISFWENHNLTYLDGLENITTVHGRLLLEGNPLINFSGLDNLTSVEGYFEISWDSFNDFSGLESLTSIGDDFRVYACVNNSNFEGLNNLTSIGGDFLLNNNGSLLNFHGLEKLESVGGTLKIDENDNLWDLDGLNNLSNIGGDLIITDNRELYSLSGLQGITSLQYDISILDNPDLKHFTGMNNLISIMGSLTISEIPDIEDLQGFNSLVSIGNTLTISKNENLLSLSGLNQLTAIDGNLLITENPRLSSLSGIENIGSTGVINISYNPSLINIGNLENLTSATSLLIIQNTNLENIQGFKNIDSDSLEYLTIRDNYKLSECDINSVCRFIAADKYAIIEYNKEGCDDIDEVETACEACFHDGAVFSTQESIDNFNSEYPSCIMIYGDLTINGTNITNLEGLSQITKIKGELRIHNNGLLSSLSGLDNIVSESITNLYIRYNPILTECEIQSVCDFLNSASGSEIDIFSNAPGCDRIEEVEDACSPGFSCLPQGITFNSAEEIEYYLNNYPDCNEIEGDVVISNPDITDLSFLNSISSFGSDLRIINNENLTSLYGLDNVTSIGGDLVIGDNTKGGNPLLNSLISLNNLTSIEGDLIIAGNNSLITLNGLDHITPGSIVELNIMNNSFLSKCEVESICGYLSGPNGIVSIENNAEGCNTKSDIIVACTEGISNINTKSLLTIFPNPARKEISILNQNDRIIEEINIYNQLGQIVLQETGKTKNIIVSNLQQGIYIIEILSQDIIVRQKLIIEE